MIDHPSGVDIGQRLQRQPVALLLLLDPGAERLLHDPAAGALQSLGKLVNLLGQRQWDVGGQYFGLHGILRAGQSKPIMMTTMDSVKPNSTPEFNRTPASEPPHPHPAPASPC